VTSDHAPSISVVVPHFNQLRLLERLLAALNAQDFDDEFEIIVADDGSDHEHDPGRLSSQNFRLVRGRHEGPAAARTAGAAAAAGEVLAFTDADCVPRAWWVQAIATHYATNPDCSATTGPLIDATTPRPSAFLHRFFKRTCEADLSPQSFDYAGVRMLGMIGANFTVRRNEFARVGGFDVAYPVPGGEDYDLAFRLQGSGARADFISDAGVEHHYPVDTSALLRRWTTYGLGKETFARKHGVPRRALHLLEPGATSPKIFLDITREHFGLQGGWIPPAPIIAELCFQRGAARARAARGGRSS
jgi:glycosyltransferase involved in cell wall biosynthesis